MLFGAIDVDVYAGLDLTAVARTLKELNLPLVSFRSKSGGAHLYLFCKEPVPASKMIAKLQEIAAAVGQGRAEIFPKQSSMTHGTSDLGSWINMPYFGGDETNRFAIKPDGDACTLEEFLEYAERSKVGPDWFTQPLRKSEGLLPDGPPCLQHLIEQGIPEGGRNKVLFNLGVYCRKAGDDWQDKVQELNQRHLKPALPHAEVLTIIKSVGRKSYGYSCADVPLSTFCDKAQCMKRTLGIGAAGKGLVQGLADAITATEHFARDKGDQLYVFRDGVYKDDGRRFIKLRVKQLLDEWKKSKDWSPELPLRVEIWLLADAPQLWEQPPLDTLNCRNGLLDIETRTLRPHDPGHLSPVQIAASFDPAARCPAIDQFVSDTFPADAHHLSAEVAGWLMLPDTSIQKAVLAVGDGSNGKSIWLNLIFAFLGVENVSAVSLHRLESDRFSAARLLGKLANVCADLPASALSGTSMLKAVTGNDVITAERKCETSFEFLPYVRLVFSANNAPRSEDSTHGFYRRWLVVPFNRTFDPLDPTCVPSSVLKARLSQPGELSGLLNKALAALPAIRSGKFTETSSTRAALDEFRAVTDPLGLWLDQNTVERNDATVAKDVLRTSYAQACQDAGRPIFGDAQFTAALTRLRRALGMFSSLEVKVLRPT